MFREDSIMQIFLRRRGCVPVPRRRSPEGKGQVVQERRTSAPIRFHRHQWKTGDARNIGKCQKNWWTLCNSINKQPRIVRSDHLSFRCPTWVRTSARRLNMWASPARASPSTSALLKVHMCDRTHRHQEQYVYHLIDMLPFRKQL